MTVRIVSYNILVCIYANDTDYYYKCQPKFLQTQYRWNLIKLQLEQEIKHHENTIICLQEVCRTLLPELESFFNQQNYIFCHKLYGESRNDYMGVGVAIPSSITLNSFSFIEIAKHLHSCIKTHEKKTSIFTRLYNLLGFVKSEIHEIRPDPWEIAMSKRNTLICLQIVVHGKSLCIGTYHMPCLYLLPDVMILHACAVKDLMFEFANGQRFILAGDFNLNPSDRCYRALVHSESNIYDAYSRSISKQRLRSAYYEKNGAEPVYTTFADTAKHQKYCDTLDYIFFAGNLMVEKVLQLTNRPTSDSYPDETHPSDHLMIAATFRLL